MQVDKRPISYLGQILNISNLKIEKVLELSIVDNCTLPFIARYRKEATGGLDELQIRDILTQYQKFIDLEKRREFILKSIDEMGKLTNQLKNKLTSAKTLTELEDLYAPYKTKRKTKGQKAIEAGLQNLADFIKSAEQTSNNILNNEIKKYIGKNGITTIEEALEGAKAIIAEEISHDTLIKENLRKDYWAEALFTSKLKKDGQKIEGASKFKDYYDFEQKISQLNSAKLGHRFLAMQRGLALKILRVNISYPAQYALKCIENFKFNDSKIGNREIIKECVKKAYISSIHPSLENEIKAQLKEIADESAINVFGVNLQNLLLQPYLGQKAVMGIDPGIRTGCKIALIDKNGNFLTDTVIYPHGSEKQIIEAKKIVETLLSKIKTEYIAIGNGTYGRETLEFLKKNIEPIKSSKVKAMLVNEDGASIYSASDIAREEFPDKDITVRGAISIARRFQDPLGELVKIDPKSIGVGQYQHDVNQTKLKDSLNTVVEHCVNYVGVDLNTSSAPLLSYVSGIGPTLAKNIVKHRSKISGFENRSELLNVGRFTEKVFEQAAGFLRIYGAKNSLDATFIHPERYNVLEQWCKRNKVETKDLIGNKDIIEKIKNDSELKKELGSFTHSDIIKSLLSPNQDPRTEFVSFEYRNDINSITDIKAGQFYPGIVTNITQFGAFVDIGIKENGLIHVSQIADRFVENPLEFLKVGQEVKAMVLEVDIERKRVSLTLKSNNDKTITEKPTQTLNKNIVTKNTPLSALKNFKIK